ncbi:hypothetical protein RCL1_008318 [Eukaryota sp. TZLM3-RCL]
MTVSTSNNDDFVSLIPNNNPLSLLHQEQSISLPDAFTHFLDRPPLPPFSKSFPEIDQDQSKLIVSKLRLSTLFDFFQYPNLSEFGEPTCSASISITLDDSPISLLFVGLSKGRVMVLSKPQKPGAQPGASPKVTPIGYLPLRIKKMFASTQSDPCIITIDAQVIHTFHQNTKQNTKNSVVVSAGDLLGNIFIWELPIMSRSINGAITSSINPGGASLIKVIDPPVVSVSSSEPLSPSPRLITIPSLSVDFLKVVDSGDGQIRLVVYYSNQNCQLITLQKSLLTVNAIITPLLPTGTSLLTLAISPGYLPLRPSPVCGLVTDSELILLTLAPVVTKIAIIELKNLYESIKSQEFSGEFSDLFQNISLSFEPVVLNQQRKTTKVPRLCCCFESKLVILTVIPHENSEEKEKKSTLGRFAVEQLLLIESVQPNIDMKISIHLWNSLNTITILTVNNFVFLIDVFPAVLHLSQLQGGQFQSRNVEVRLEESLNVAGLSLIRRDCQSLSSSFNQSFLIDFSDSHCISDANGVLPVILQGSDSISCIFFTSIFGQAEEFTSLSSIVGYEANESTRELVVSAIKHVAESNLTVSRDYVSVCLFIINFAIKNDCFSSLLELDFSQFTSSFLFSYLSALEILIISNSTLNCLLPNNLLKSLFVTLNNLENSKNRIQRLISSICDLVVYQVKNEKAETKNMIDYLAFVDSLIDTNMIYSKYCVSVTKAEITRLQGQNELFYDFFSQSLSFAFQSFSNRDFFDLIKLPVFDLFPGPLSCNFDPSDSAIYVDCLTLWLLGDGLGQSALIELFTKFSFEFLNLLKKCREKSTVDSNHLFSVLIGNLIGSPGFPLLAPFNSLPTAASLALVLEFLALDFLSNSPTFFNNSALFSTRTATRIIVQLASSTLGDESGKNSYQKIPMSKVSRSIILTEFLRKILKNCKNEMKFPIANLQELSNLSVINRLYPSAVFLTALYSPIEAIKLLSTLNLTDSDILPFSFQSIPITVSNVVEELLSDSKQLLSQSEFQSLELTIVKVVPILAKINPMTTASLAGRKLTKYITQIIPSLETSPFLLFTLLEELDNSNMLPDDAITIFVVLLCEFNPNRAFSYLKAKETLGVNLTTVLEAANKFNVTSVASYVLERTGDISGALKLRLSDLNQSLLDLYPDSDSIKLRQSITCLQEALSLCFRALSVSELAYSGPFESILIDDLEDPFINDTVSCLLNHKIWDEILKNDELVPKFSPIFLELISTLAISLGPNYLLRQITSKCCHFPMNFLSKSISHLLEVMAFNSSMSSAAVNSVAGDTLQFSHELVTSAKRACLLSNCALCGNSFIGKSGNIKCFFCNHMFHDDCLSESNFCPLCTKK